MKAPKIPVPHGGRSTRRSTWCPRPTRTRPTQPCPRGPSRTRRARSRRGRGRRSTAAGAAAAARAASPRSRPRRVAEPRAPSGPVAGHGAPAPATPREPPRVDDADHRPGPGGVGLPVAHGPHDGRAVPSSPTAGRCRTQYPPTTTTPTPRAAGRGTRPAPRPRAADATVGAARIERGAVAFGQAADGHGLDGQVAQPVLSVRQSRAPRRAPAPARDVGCSEGCHSRYVLTSAPR